MWSICYFEAEQNTTVMMHSIAGLADADRHCRRIEFVCIDINNKKPQLHHEAWGDFFAFAEFDIYREKIYRFKSNLALCF
jgi:hypothetical protein